MSSDVIDGRSNIGLRDSTIRANLPTSNIVQMNNLQSIQSRSRVCGESEFSLKVQSVSLNLKPGNILFLSYVLFFGKKIKIKFYNKRYEGWE